MLFGAGGYLGSALAAELDRRSLPWVRGGWRTLSLPSTATFVINAAAFIPPASVALCDERPFDTLQGNLALPATLTRLCRVAGVPLAHLSTGCLWNDGQEHDEDSPIQRAFTGHCGFYVGIKALAEKEVRRHPSHYIWRVRLPFDEQAGPRNYLTKLATLPEVWMQENSVSHRADFARACLDLWQARALWGTYHVVNSGTLCAQNVAICLHERGIRSDPPVFVDRQDGACRLSNAKLLAAGVKMRSVREALDDALANWTTPPPNPT